MISTLELSLRLSWQENSSLCDAAIGSNTKIHRFLYEIYAN